VHYCLGVLFKVWFGDGFDGGLFVGLDNDLVFYIFHGKLKRGFGVVWARLGVLFFIL